MDVETEMIPRPYQSEMEDKSLRCNSIIYLPTGSGKTFIAMKVIRRLGNYLTEHGQKCFFLVNTVPLVDQQRLVLESGLPFRIGGYSSNDKVDFWDQLKWNEELDKHDVIVMTSQILLDVLLHNYLTFSQIKLIIFDECHHATGNHPMIEIMKLYETKSEPLPRIIGLTSTLVNKNVKFDEIEEEIEALEKAFKAKVNTVDSLNTVSKFSTNPEEITKLYEPYDLQKCDEEIIKDIKEFQSIVLQLSDTNIKPQILEGGVRIDQSKNIYNQLKNALTLLAYHFELFGTFGGRLSILSLMVDIELMKLTTKFSNFHTILKTATTVLVTCMQKIEKSMRNISEAERIIQCSSPKVQLLLQILKEYNPNINHIDPEVNKYNKELSCVIFVKEKITAKILSKLLNILKEKNEDFEFLNIDYIFGANINPYCTTREELYRKKQHDLGLLKFKNRLVNCMISTSVLEEGIDIPHCTLIVRFDEIFNFCSYIQSKGRARNADSAFVMFVEEKERLKFTNRYTQFQLTEAMFNKILIGDNKYRTLQTGTIDDPIEFYNYKNASITSNSAISLLNTYCSQLYSCKFLSIQPEYYLFKTADEKSFVSVYLPVASGIKDPIQGAPKSNIKDAKKSAALKACMELHKIGQLNDNLIPALYDDDENDANVEELFFSHWIKDSEYQNSCQKTYKKKMPECLKGAEDVTFPQQYYVHHIKMTPKRESDNLDCNVIDDLIESKNIFVILTISPMLPMSIFSTYLSSGEVSVEIETNVKNFSLSKTQLENIKRFQLLLFNEVLRIHKSFMSYDISNSEYHFFVAPAINDETGIELDWHSIENYKSINKFEMPSESQRKSMVFTKERFLHQVISPWYRPDGEDIRYIVTEVCENLNPSSSFENEQYESYKCYYKSKYYLDIVGSESQPLLRVRYLSGKMNALLPRAMTLFKSHKEALKYQSVYADEIPNTNEYLIPEFCVKFEFPGVLWLKATLLPSIIHRMTLLLQAEELRRLVVENTGIGTINFPEGEEWRQLTYNFHAVSNATKNPSGRGKHQNNEDDLSNDDSFFQNENKMATSTNISNYKNSATDGRFALAQKALDQQFPWPKNDEPIDIEKNFDRVSVLDIQFYHEFINQPCQTAQTDSPLDIILPKTKAKSHSKRAIGPPEMDSFPTINILNSRPSVTGPQQVNILETMVIHKANDIINLERLETLGDSFLKLAASLYISQKYPTFSEGKLTGLKGRIVSNRNLYFSGVLIDIPSRMKVQRFNPKYEWMTPAFTVPVSLMPLLEKDPDLLNKLTITNEEMLSGILNDSTVENFIKSTEHLRNDEKIPTPGTEVYFNKQIVRHKSVSDCIEALIGAYLLDSGIDAALKILYWLRILPLQEEYLFSNLTKTETPYSLKLVERSQIEFLLDNSVSKIENILGYKFEDPCLLLEALSHPSYIKNRITNNYQRLEFIGDAVLDFLITCFIYERCSHFSPGDLTDLRSALVNNNTFGCYVIRLGLHKFIQTNNVGLENAIIKFAQFQKQRDNIIDDAVLYLIDDDSAKIAETVEIPKALGDVFESLAGAIFLDSRKNFNTVWKVFYNIMHEEIAKFSIDIPKQPIRLLYECIHASPSFSDAVVLSNKTVMVPLQVTVDGKRVIVHGCGQNKQLAKLSSAKIALRMLNISV